MPSTWLVVVVQVAGALLTAVVIKFAGNVLKTFATVLALLCTCVISMLLFDFHPTSLFAAGVATTAISVWLYSRPKDIGTVAAWLLACGKMPSAAVVKEKALSATSDATVTDSPSLSAVTDSPIISPKA